MSAAGLTRTAVWCETLEGGIEDIRDVVVHDRVGLAVKRDRRSRDLRHGIKVAHADSSTS